MSFLNVNLNILAYADGPASNQPQVRLADFKWSLMGLPTDKVRQIPISLSPGESVVVASNTRTISLSGSDTLEITAQPDGKMRISGSFGQRVARSSGDESTEWELTKSGEMLRIKAVGGTPADLSAVQAGDGVTLGDAFGTYNRGDFVVLSKGSDYIDVRNLLAADETVTGKVQIYSSGPVQKNDILDITSTAFAFPNRGSFPVSRVTDDFIEVLNPNVITETVTGVISGFSVYPYAYKWLFVAVDRKVSVGLNGDSGNSVEVEPHVEGDYSRNPGVLLKRGKVFEVLVTNPGLSVASGILMLAE